MARSSRLLFLSGKMQMVTNDKSCIEITTEAAWAVVAFKAASISDADTINSASRKIAAFIEENHPARMIFDFAGVKFFSSQVLGMILNVRSKLEAYKGEVVICSIDPQLYRVFRITNLDSIFRFFPDMKKALEEA